MEQGYNLTQTSLHDITIHYGLNGLVQRFVDEVEALDISAEDHERIDTALELALCAHSSQSRGELPYATHVVRVATRIICHFRVADPEIIIGALLHDTVEDQPGWMAEGLVSDAEDPGYRSAALETVRRGFGNTVLRLLVSVTNPEFDAATDCREQYRYHVIESMARSPGARVIKLSDFIDNCAGIIYNEDTTRAHRLAGKYLPLVPAMIRFALAADTPLEPAAREYIVAALSRAKQNCESLLEQDNLAG